MVDSLRRHRAIKEQLLQLCPNATGRALQHLEVKHVFFVRIFPLPLNRALLLP